MKKKAEAVPDKDVDQGARINSILQERKNMSETPVESKIIKEYCIIETGGRLFGIQIEYLREVFDVRDQADIIPIPFTPASLQGVVNVRGEILPVVSLGEVLGFARDQRPSKMVVADVHLKVAFPAAKILDLVQMNISDIRQVREGVNASEIRFVNGEFTRDGNTVLVIDMLKLFSSSYFREAQ